MTLQGKGYFIWKIADCEGGNIGAIVSLAQAANLGHLVIKIADGAYSFNVNTDTGEDLASELTQALHAQGFEVWGWHYVYGDAPISEAAKAIQRIQQVQVDGYVIDAESEYKQSGKHSAAVHFMSQLRGSLPKLPVALSSFRFPSMHPDFPWKEFLNQINFNMPQVYWVGAHNPGAQLIRCVKEFQALTPYRPVIPTGMATSESGWKPTPADEIEFLNTARSLNLQAANFWDWAETRVPSLPGVWEAIRDYSWTVGNTQPQDICQQYISMLNTHDPKQVAQLYSPTAVQVTSSRTIQGADAISAWFKTLFSQLLPNATFTLTHFTGNGSSRHLTWTATSSAGKVQDGNDTFGLVNNTIAYHYSFFTISR